MGTPGLTVGSLSVSTTYETSFQGGLLSNLIPSSLYTKSGTNHFLRSEPGFQKSKAFTQGHKLWSMELCDPSPAGPQNLLLNSPELQNHQRSTRIVLFSLKKKTILLGEFLRKWQIILLFWFVCMYVCVYASVCVLKTGSENISKGGT